ncbi:GMC family oxidoreductase [Solihabitans fulvus]|uniref:GMC family oxidoreductase n=1 Tax=Solihabitans fulvus TaxID=1892852 RepID=A0A5B2X7Z6_9PSEU|nr:GMC oxidoreductase [Solihabitans fulvus]KAA2259159.1 GMC family oxidoreductase [Solihabitans fulvus]
MTTANRRTRIAIVGGGMAGLELAKELHRRGVTDLLVIEAGPAKELRHVNRTTSPEDALQMFLAPHNDPHFHRPWTSESSPHYDGRSGLRRRLGGRSLYWWGATVPIEDWALNDPAWPSAITQDLRDSWRDGPSLYERVAADLGVEAALSTSPPTPLAIGSHRFSTVVRAYHDDPTDPDQWAAYSPLDYWRDPFTGAALRDPDRPPTLSDTEVLAVTTHSGTVTGLTVRHRTTGELDHIAAETVVLSAGTIENSRLAIQARHTANNSVPPRLAGLTDHIVHGFAATLNVARNPNLPEGSYFMPGGPQVRANVFLDLFWQNDNQLYVNAKTTGEQLRNEDSYVDCVPADSYPWEVRVHTSLSARDNEVVSAERDLLNNIWHELAESLDHPAEDLPFDDFQNPATTNDTVLPESADTQPVGKPMAWSVLLGTEEHEGGTLPLGGVVDERHELAGVRGLHIAGPSLFPRMGAANPSLTTLALARRLAAILAD